MATEEQDITTVRYIVQRLKIDEFEDAALSEISSAYMKAKKTVATSLDKAIARELAKVGTNKVPNPAAVTRLKALQKEIAGKIDDISSKLTPYVADAAAEVGAYSSKDTADILSWGGRVTAFNNVGMTAKQLKALMLDEPYGGKTLDDWLFSAFKGEHQALYDEVISDIRAGRIAGTGYKGIMASLKSRYSNLLDNEEVKRNLETVTKSYIQAANAKAHADLYDANKAVIKGVEWSAILENANSKTGRGTCKRCQGLDGQKYKSKEDAPNCPLHPRCRCMLLPTTKSWEELGIDAEGIDEIRSEVDKKYGPAMRKWSERDLGTRKKLDDGKIDGNYADLWDTKPEFWQNNAVGPVRAQLIRDELIDFEDIVVYSKGYKDSLKQQTGRDYALGDTVTINDLSIWAGIKDKPGAKKVKPKPKEAPKPKAKPKALPPLGASSAEDLFSNAPKTYVAAYHRKLLEADTGYTVEKKVPEKGAYYQPALRYINQDPLLTNKKNTMTFLHEYGHRADAKAGLKMANKWGGNNGGSPWHGVQFASDTKDYRAALYKDQDTLRGVFRTDYKKLGGTGPPSAFKLDELRRDAKREFRKELPPYGDARNLALKNIAENEVKGDLVDVLTMSEKFLFDKKKAAITSAQKIGFDQRAEDIYTGVIMSQRTGVDTFVLDDVLDAFNYPNKAGDDTAHMMIADAVGATTKNKYGWGHSDSYYDETLYQGLEAFGNIFATYGDKTSRNVLKKYLPNQVSMFEDFLKEV